MKNRTIYLIRKKAIGDVLWIEPLIRQLAKEYKRVKVYTMHQELFENYPLKNVSFIVKRNLFLRVLTKIEHFFKTHFFVINLDRSYEQMPLQHFLHAYQLKAGLPVNNDHPKIYLSKEEQAYDPRILGPFVILHIESSSDKRNTRKIFGIDWKIVTAYLKQKGFQVIQIGVNDGQIPGTLFRSTNSLRELISLINKASFFMGMDSGPAHLAVTLNKPSVLFFGSVDPAFRFFSDQVKGVILQHYCEFAGCYHLAKDPTTLACRIVGESGIPPCSNFNSEEVVEAVDLVINKYVMR